MTLRLRSLLKVAPQQNYLPTPGLAVAKTNSDLCFVMKGNVWCKRTFLPITIVAKSFTPNAIA